MTLSRIAPYRLPAASSDRQTAELPPFASECRNLDLLRRAGGVLNLIHEIVIVRWLRPSGIGTIDRTLGDAHGPIIGNHGSLLLDIVIIKIVRFHEIVIVIEVIMDRMSHD